VLESPLASKSNPNPSEQEMIEFVPSGYISIREALSRSIWRMRARPLAAPRVSSGSGDCSLRNVSRIGTIQRNRPLQRAKILARAAYPQDRSSNANSLWWRVLADPTRVVTSFQIHGSRTDSGVRVLPPQPRSRLFRSGDGRGQELT
jgi:hypothetical protein